MKKIILLVTVMLSLPAMADTINFSGAQNSASKSYPQLPRSSDEVQPAKEAREIKTNPQAKKQPPMTYGNFPQNYDSANSMMLMQQYGIMPGAF
ncbi:MAG: hypothetical protein LBK53_09625 [Heliobacteriaceae bacterium]|jgi:hypothetical protein|nr:hypothetical protein [Heliobacteriaceae bacterium]